MLMFITLEDVKNWNHIFDITIGFNDEDMFMV